MSGTRTGTTVVERDAVDHGPPARRRRGKLPPGRSRRMDDERRRLEAVEREEARFARRAEREDLPPVGSEAVELRRLFSSVLEVALGLRGETADAFATEVLDRYDYAVARRAVELYAVRLSHMAPLVLDDVLDICATLVEADRLADLRRRAREGDEVAAADLARARDAMRRAVDGG
jgi:hypothetical protein